MNRELEKKLTEDFSFMIAKNTWTGKICLDEEGKTFGFPCSYGDGWYQLTHDLCRELTDLYIANGINPDIIEMIQVKEKFGGMRFYTGSLLDGGHDIIQKYEDKSYEICEVCGEAGELCRRGSWYMTLCDKHRDEMNYVKTE